MSSRPPRRWSWARPTRRNRSCWCAASAGSCRRPTPTSWSGRRPRICSGRVATGGGLHMAFDVIVVGVGGMGSATAFQLARRKQRVLGLERFDIPHAMGSSHGISRIIRLPYYEHSSYVPLLQRAFVLWREIETLSNQEILVTTGSIDGGREDGELFNGALASARLHDLPHEVLTGAEVNARYPGYNLPSALRAVFQPQGGLL